MLRIATVPSTPPAAEPVTLAECKLDSRIDGTEFDVVIPTLITAARQMAEQECGAKLITQTWRVETDAWPCERDTIGGLTPYQSAAVTYWNGSTWATLATDQWAMLRVGGALLLAPAYGVTWPTLGDLVGPRVRIDITCGYGATADNVPQTVRTWIRAHVAAMLRTPDGHAREIAPLPYLSGLLDPARVY